jgi:hypothetical protein
MRAAHRVARRTTAFEHAPPRMVAPKPRAPGCARSVAQHACAAASAGRGRRCARYHPSWRLKPTGGARARWALLCARALSGTAGLAARPPAMVDTHQTAPARLRHSSPEPIRMTIRHVSF